MDLVEVDQGNKRFSKAVEFKYSDEAINKSYTELMNFNADEKIVFRKQMVKKRH